MNKIGIDQYCLHPLALGPVAILDWAASHGAEGVAFSGFPADQQGCLDEGLLRETRQEAARRGLYIEWGGATHIPRDMTSWASIDIEPINRRAVEQASLVGARIIRSCSGGLMRWQREAPPTETLLSDTAEALDRQRSIFEDNGVTLAIETHFEFTSHELLRIFDQCDAEPGGWLGICLDTMNLLTLLEEPVAATTRLLPWIVSTHVKDGALLLDDDGLASFTTAVGDGIVDLARIVSLVASLGRDIHLSIEDHGGCFHLPIFDPVFLSRFPDLGVQEFAALVQLAGVAAGTPTCVPTPRDHWPSLLETRVPADIERLKRLRDD